MGEGTCFTPHFVAFTMAEIIPVDPKHISPGTTTARIAAEMSAHWIAFTPTLRKIPILKEVPFVPHTSPASLHQMAGHHSLTSTPDLASSLAPMASTLSLGKAASVLSVWSEPAPGDSSVLLPEDSNMDVDPPDLPSSSSPSSPPSSPPVRLTTAPPTAKRRSVDWSSIELTLLFVGYTMSRNVLLYLLAIKRFFTSLNRTIRAVGQFIRRVRALGLLLVLMWIGYWPSTTSAHAFETKYKDDPQVELVRNIVAHVVFSAILKSRSILNGKSFYVSN